MGSFSIMFFVQYSYPSHVQGKMFGIFLLVFALAIIVLPVITEIKNNFEIGWEIYRKVSVAICLVSIMTTSACVLLSYNKDWVVNDQMCIHKIKLEI